MFELEFQGVDIDRAALAAEVTPMLVRVHSQTTRRIRVLAVGFAPQDTGELDRSIREDPQVIMPMRVSGGVTAHARHAIFVHEGTRAHTIEVDEDSPMVFMAGGQKVFASVVHVPAHPPNPFLKRALDIATDEI